MDQFMIRFLLCNLLLSGIIGVLLLGKRLLKNSLSSRMQYNLWFLLLGLLAVPFVPVQKINFALQKASAAPIKQRRCQQQNPFWHGLFVLFPVAVWHRRHACLADAVCDSFSQNQTIRTPAAKSCGLQTVS